MYMIKFFFSFLLMAAGCPGCVWSLAFKLYIVFRKIVPEKITIQNVSEDLERYTDLTGAAKKYNRGMFVLI